MAKKAIIEAMLSSSVSSLPVAAVVITSSFAITSSRMILLSVVSSFTALIRRVYELAGLRPVISKENGSPAFTA